MTGHLTRRQLEQLVADDPRAPIPPVFRVHVSGCDRCTVRRLALASARSRYLEEQPAADFARAVAERAVAPIPAVPMRVHKRHLIAPIAGVLAAAAVMLLLPRPAVEPAAIRSKGGVSLEVVAKHGAIQQPLRDGDRLAPGDQLAFAYSLDRPRHVLLLGVDGAGEITCYFPANATQEHALAATPGAQLPIGVELDTRKGDERLYVLFSDEALDEAEVRSALLRDFDAARARGEGVRVLRALELQQPADQWTVWFQKS